jgi:ADP-ribose pyrophosphatase YjhB (NUDIX family)
MIWTIKVPAELRKKKDIREIDVITDDELKLVLARKLIDDSFKPVNAKIKNSENILELNNEILKIAFDNACSLVVFGKDGNLTLYRARKVRREGTECVGLGIGIIILNENDEVVLTLRGITTNNRAGFFELPGGTVEFGESLSKAVIKEAKEETGLDVLPVGCVSICEDYIEGQHWISFGYLTKVVGGKLENKEPYKFKEVKFVPLNNLPKNTAKLTKKVLDDWKKSKGNFMEIEKVKE